MFFNSIKEANKLKTEINRLLSDVKVFNGCTLIQLNN